MRITLAEAMKYAVAGAGGAAQAQGLLGPWKDEYDAKVTASFDKAPDGPGKPANADAVKTAWTTKPPTAATLKTIADAASAGVWVPLEIIIARPFIEHLMMSAVLTVAGRDTGATLFGPAGARRRLSGPCTHFPSP